MEPIIRNLTPQLAERGKIKIGEKGEYIKSQRGTEFQPPKKLDHFRVVTLERGPDGNYLVDKEVHSLYGSQPRELPIRLLYDDIALNIQSRYACFPGKTLWCYGDGEEALRLVNEQTGQREKVPCPCGRQEPTYSGKDRCKISTKLSCLIDGVESVGGIWTLRTTSYNSTVGLLSSLALIKRITGGPLANIPLMLTLRPKTVVSPTDGRVQTVWVVGVEYRGSIDSLRELGYERARMEAQHKLRIEQIEEEARRLLLAAPEPVPEHELSEFVEEFVPEAVSIQTIEYPKTEEKIVPEPQGEPTHQRRRRTKKFQIPKELREQLGTELLQTCGATPEQLLKIKKEATSSKEKASMVKQFMALVGYDQLSYLTYDEAQNLLTALLEPIPKTSDEVKCPVRDGDVVSKEYCLKSCSDRRRNGWCPEVDEPLAEEPVDEYTDEDAKADEEDDII